LYVPGDQEDRRAARGLDASGVEGRRLDQRRLGFCGS
jgi:hypothetical protein